MVKSHESTFLHEEIRINTRRYRYIPSNIFNSKESKHFTHDFARRMQLDTLYCETVGGVFDVPSNPHPSMKDLSIENSGPEIMSVPGDRKRKYVNNTGGNERETRSEQSRNSLMRAQHRQRSEDSKDGDDSDQTYSTKKLRSRKTSKTEKNEKICGDKYEKTSQDYETSKRDEEPIKNRTECSESDKDESSSEKNDEKTYEESIGQLEAEDNDLKEESTNNMDNITHRLEEEHTAITVDKQDSNDIPKDKNEFNSKDLKTNTCENEQKSSTIHELTEKVNFFDVSHNVTKSRSSLDDGNNFSVERICETASSLYNIQKGEKSSNTEANHVEATKPLSPLYNEERLTVNNNDFQSALITPVDDGCAANSKFTKFPNVASDRNVEAECDTANISISQKDSPIGTQTQMLTYKEEVDKSTNPTTWETTNRESSYGNPSEACCFRATESDTNIGLIGQPQETKTSHLDMYTNPTREAYSVNLPPHERHKESSAEEFSNENEMINRKTETSQLAKMQSEQHIHQSDFGQYTFDYGWLEQVQETQKPIHNKNIMETDQSYIRAQSLQQQQQQHHIAQSMPAMPHQHSHLQESLQGEHLMAYLHHQAAMAGAGHQSRLQQDIYQDLMMDDFHEDANPQTYKLRHLSPTTTKHENQDDGYETSAGDVLTPNSHSSSTHSGTPQLPVSLHVPTSALALQNVSTATNCNPNSSNQQQSQMQPIQANNVPEDFNRDTNVSVPNDSYKFSGNPDPCLSDKVERLFPLQSEQQANLHNQNLSNQPLHGENLSSSIKTDITDIMGCKEASQLVVKPPQKRRGRKKKIQIIEGMSTIQSHNVINPAGISDGCRPADADGSTGLLKVKERKKHDRFNGMSEEEVVKRTLPDHLCHNLDIVIIGINPGLFAAYKGHHYAGPGNHFWKCLYLSGLTQEQMSADEDYKLLKCGIGFTNMVQRATKGSADLTRKEIKEGSRILLEKLQRFQPKIAVFNGKLIFEVFSGKKDFNFGRQPECVDGTNTYVWVMPSSSARCAQLPRAADKVPFYAALKKFRDYLNGLVSQIDEEECVFTEQRIRQMCEQEQLKNLAQSHTGCSYNNLNDCPTNVTDQKHQSSGEYTAYSSNDNELNGGAVNVSESAIGGPGPPTIVSHGSGYLVSQHFPGQPHPTPEKKKRGRPKKLRVQEIIDPNTGQKIQITNSQHHQQPNVNNDFNNILNLSMMSAEIPKKKRGRPKKVKPVPTEMHVSAETQNLTVSQQQPSSQISLYNNPPSSSVQQQLYGHSVASPNHSPALNPAAGVNNGSVIPYTPSNNATTSQMTPPTNDSSVDLASNNNKPNLDGSTPPSSSPNICTVDFDPPNSSEHSSQVELHTQQLTSSLQQQRNRFETQHIVGVDSGTNESFHQWMSPSHQFNYPTSLQQETQQQYQTDHNLSIQHRSQKQNHENVTQQQQQSPHSPWTTLQRSQHFESNEGNHHQQQQQQQHYMSAMNTASQHQHQHQNQQQQQQQHHQTVQHSTDVATKSLSGLESLVDQIPTIAESEAAAAAVESRLQTLQRGSTPGSFGDLQSEGYEGNLINDNRSTNSLAETTNDTLALSRNSSNGSNTPHYGVNSGPSCPSPINHYGMQRHTQASSPHTSYSGSISGSGNFQLHNSPAQHSPSVSSDLLSNSHTPPHPTMANSNTTTTNSSTTTSHHLFSNFSVSHLAASSVTSCSSNNTNNSNKSNEWQSSGTRSPYHHPNLMAAAALQLHSAASSSPPTPNPSHQMYIDPHTSIHHHPHHSHLSSPHQHHVQVNSLYTSAAQAAHTHHHHPGMSVAYGAPPPTSQHPSHHVHNATADYGAYGASAAAAAAHMLHIPNPNYSPYGYGAAPPPVPTGSTQNSYSSWNHHGHPTATGHHPHHLSMFERLKPSDIGSYSSF